MTVSTFQALRDGELRKIQGSQLAVLTHVPENLHSFLRAMAEKAIEKGWRVGPCVACTFAFRRTVDLNIYRHQSHGSRIQLQS
jgi:hypothetical protein